MLRRALVSGSALNTCEVYDPLTSTWTAISGMGTGRSQSCAASVGGKIYVMGGFGGSYSRSILNACEVYDPSTNIWTPISSMGTARKGACAARIERKIFVIGGCALDAVDTFEHLSARNLTSLDSAPLSFSALLLIVRRVRMEELASERAWSTYLSASSRMGAR